MWADDDSTKSYFSPCTNIAAQPAKASPMKSTANMRDTNLLLAPLVILLVLHFTCRFTVPAAGRINSTRSPNG